jgi:hypothetical protein
MLGDNPWDGWLADVVEARHLGAGLPAGDDALSDFAPFGGVELLASTATRPSARAAAMPAEVRSRIMARSNSADEPIICIIMRPAGWWWCRCSLWSTENRRQPERFAP